VRDVAGQEQLRHRHELVVFEHLPDPEAALKNVTEALKPGGVFYISIHLYTANNGSSRYPAFTGDEDSLPLWGHLRPSTKDQIHPSAYLNEWRRSQYRDLFRELAPGHSGFLERFDVPERYGPMLTGALREELSAVHGRRADRRGCCVVEESEVNVCLPARDCRRGLRTARNKAAWNAAPGTTSKVEATAR
jgi:SAM-dependent methyltransferase